MSGSQGQVNPIRVEELSFIPRQQYKRVSFVGKHSGKELSGFDFTFEAWGPQEQQAIDRIFDQNTVTAIDPVTGRSFEATVRLLTSSYTEGAPTVHGDVELTHLRQFGLTHLFQVARSWRAPSSLVDADRGLCHLV